MRPWLRKTLKALAFAHGIILTGLLLTHCSYSNFARKSYASAAKERPYDVIIVPGVPYDALKPNQVMKMRLFWAKHLYDSGYARNIIFSGSSVYTAYVEGVVMKIMADSLGIPADHTFSETKAEHSTENIYYSWKLARQMGFQKIALATDPYQAGLLRRFVMKYCPGMKSIPIIFGLIDISSKTLPHIDAQSAHVAGFVSIVERQGFWERFARTRGKQVKAEVEAEAARAGHNK